MIRKFFSFYKPHKKLFVLDIICSFIFAALGLVYPRLAETITNKYIPNKDITMILVMAAIILAVFLLRAVVAFIIHYWGHLLGVKIQGDMRSVLFKHLQKLPYTYYDENKTGSIMSRVTNDLFEIAELAHHGPEDTFISLVTIIGVFIILMIYNTILTPLIFALIPFMILFAALQRRRMRASFRESREKTSEINAGIESSISGIRVTKTYTASEYEIQKFEKTNGEFKNARRKAYKNMGIFFSGMGLFNNLLYLIALTAAAIFYLKNYINEGQFISFLLFVNILLTPIGNLVGIFEQIQDGITGFTRFTEILNIQPEVESENAVELDTLSGDISFNNITFSYKNKESETRVIKDFSLQIKEGNTVAFVGPSGGGKTTLCHLLPRFYEIDNGSITIGEKNINEITRHSLRKNIGLIAQDVFLFAGTIRENIMYGKIDATEDEIIEAAKKANIHDFIMRQPLKYDSLVGERGVKLSGGQKQRISIARAFLKNPPILILDEATSSLDNVTEMQIQQSLEELSKGRTTIIVAHRLSTIKNCDEIFVLTSEGISERGNHAELMEKNGFYSHLYSYYER